MCSSKPSDSLFADHCHACNFVCAGMDHRQSLVLGNSLSSICSLASLGLANDLEWASSFVESIGGYGSSSDGQLSIRIVLSINWFSFLFEAIGGNSLMAWGQTWLVIAHLVWAGVGMALLARRLGLNPLAQAVSGLSFELSGYLVARVGFLQYQCFCSMVPMDSFSWFQFG